MATGTKYVAVDNFSTTLSNAPGTGGTTFVLGSTAALPANVLDGTYPILVTAITDATYQTTSESKERVVLTWSSGTTFTASRSFGSDTALDLAIGDHIEIRTVATQINDAQDALISAEKDINTAALAATSITSSTTISATGNVTGANLSGTNTGDEVAATTGVAGVVELATTAETTTGTDTARAVTPAALKGATHAFTSSITASNLSGTNTGDEVAATTSVAGVVELALETEVETGTDTSRAVTPAALQDADHAFSGDITFAGDINLTSTGCNKFWETPMYRPNDGLIAAGTNPPASIATRVYSANRREVTVATCNDSVTSRLMGVAVLPDDYDGSALGFDVYFSVATANAGNVYWQIQASTSASDGGDLTDTAVATSGSTGIEAAPGVVDQLATASGTISPTGATDAAGQLLFFAVLRVGADASDTYTSTGDHAYLIGVKFYYA